MIYGDEKQLSMARSVLPAKARTRKAARQARRTAHHRERTAQRSNLARLPQGGDYDERPIAADAQLDVRDMVSRRRGSDKLAPLIRWANAHADDLGADPASRQVALRALLPDGLIGDHAMSHVRYEDAFDDRPESPWTTAWRHRRIHRPRDLQSLRDRLVHRLGVDADRLGELNRALKDTPTPSSTGVTPPPPRLIAGVHDRVPFVDHYLEALEPWRGCGCSRHADRARFATLLRFFDLDPADPLARPS